ncbi:ATPase family associated with various cellular activities (AAA) [Rubripirellula obstinata]|uniref:ATPase family associated with various cellular activities (AAA) n=1 Tax=Rubripirellula obstinata TaxID=406547 RepID=A0A5B1CE27_9BACT|nr:MoxR family ATPase [Rubripirellula obstinata]KAA1258836.1 ATPase family associated with various cellular activities (AAA) [Rubripirellula obstinata]
MNAPTENESKLTSDAQHTLEKLLGNLQRVIRGKPDSLELLLSCLAAKGHALLEDVPGTGKTTLAKTLAISTGCVFNRVQFTPDLLPSDIVGSSILNTRDSTFKFNRGPIFANVLLADEINRASPRTQSALLEAMGEQQVTVDGQTYPLDSPFLCIATQNPVEFHGTYPLPEAQLDRFMVRLSLGYVSEEEELRILHDQRSAHPLDDLQAVANADAIVQVQQAVELVEIEDSVMRYLLSVITATRNHAAVQLGVSTRGSLQFTRMVRALALMKGRSFVIPDDVKKLAEPVLAHRLVLDTRARYAGTEKAALIGEILHQLPVPR